jgi:predicted nucleotidyltransferase
MNDQMSEQVSQQSMHHARPSRRLDAGAVASARLDDTARAVVDATISAVDPEQVILFGSRARGDARADSDLDLMVIMHDPFTAEYSRQEQLRRVRRALHGFRIPVDILLYSRDEIDTWRESPNHVIGRSLREGVTVYARR